MEPSLLVRGSPGLTHRSLPGSTESPADPPFSLSPTPELEYLRDP